MLFPEYGNGLGLERWVRGHSRANPYSRKDHRRQGFIRLMAEAPPNYPPLSSSVFVSLDLPSPFRI